MEQWLLFEKGEGKENVEPCSSFVGKMWKAFSRNLTGKDQGAPWFAVAISLMVRNAAKTVDGYRHFPQSIGHARYMGIPGSKRRPRCAVLGCDATQGQAAGRRHHWKLAGHTFQL